MAVRADFGTGVLSTDNSTDRLPTTLEHHWMPFTANRAFKASPRFFVDAKDMHFTTDDGRRVLDATAGMWCVNAGHCREPIAQAIADQAARLDYSPVFQMGNPLSFALAERLVPLLPAPIDHVFFVNSGSEAVDTALKIALAFHHAHGEPGRAMFVGRERAYHGVGFGGLSVGGIPVNRTQFAAQLLPKVAHLPTTHDLERNAFSRGQPAHGAEGAEVLERIVAEQGANQIAAVIVEPVAGSTGVLVPPVGYLERLRAICDRHRLLLIFDEVITGFGRLGAPFAAQRFGVVPDMITAAKGLTNGAVPMGAVFVRDEIYHTIVNNSATPVELFHGYTYSSHPLACAAALATLDVYRDEGLFERSAALAPAFENALHSVRGSRHVIDVRNFGLMGAIELTPRPGAPGARAYEAFVRCFEQGVLVRSAGDNIALSPPLIATEEQFGEAVAIIRKVLETLP